MAQKDNERGYTGKDTYSEKGYFIVIRSDAGFISQRHVVFRFLRDLVLLD